MEDKMKRFLIILLVFFAAGAALYAQQPTTSQTKQNAQQYSNQANSNASQFESTLSELRSMNVSNTDLVTFNRLKGEIDRLETQINSEEKSIRERLDKGILVSAELMTRIERLIALHATKVKELNSFISN